MAIVGRELFVFQRHRMPNFLTVPSPLDKVGPLTRGDDLEPTKKRAAIHEKTQTADARGA